MLITKNKKIIAITEQLKKEFKSIYKDRLSKLILFGSQARSDAQQDSDIDILVVLKDEVNPVKEIMRNSYLISELCLKYDSLINCFYVSELTLNEEKKPLIKNIKKDGILL
jgi:predicted nucleotidyltransferase